MERDNLGTRKVKYLRPHSFLHLDIGDPSINLTVYLFNKRVYQVLLATDVAVEGEKVIKQI